jgi:hypothetical protein
MHAPNTKRRTQIYAIARRRNTASSCQITQITESRDQIDLPLPSQLLGDLRKSHHIYVHAQLIRTPLFLGRRVAHARA